MPERVWKQEASKETHALIQVRGDVGLSKQDGGWRVREGSLKKHFVARTDISRWLTGRGRDTWTHFHLPDSMTCLDGDTISKKGGHKG